MQLRPGFDVELISVCMFNKSTIIIPPSLEVTATVVALKATPATQGILTTAHDITSGLNYCFHIKRLEYMSIFCHECHQCMAAYVYQVTGF